MMSLSTDGMEFAGGRRLAILYHCGLICKTKPLKLLADFLPWHEPPAIRSESDDMKSSRRLLLYFVTVFVCLSLLAGCGAPPQNTTPATNSVPRQIAGKRGGRLVYRITQPVNTLNYYLAADEPSVLVTLFLLNDRLVTFDHEKQAYVPMLAESYTPAADGQTV